MDKREVEKPPRPTLLKTNQFDIKHKVFYGFVGVMGIVLFLFGLGSRSIAIWAGILCVLTAGLLTVWGRKTSRRNTKLNVEAKIRYSQKRLEYQTYLEMLEEEKQSDIDYVVVDRPDHIERIRLIQRLEGQGYSSIKIMTTLSDPIYGEILWCYLDYVKTYVNKNTGEVVSDQNIIDALDHKYGRSPEERGIIYD